MKIGFSELRTLNSELYFRIKDNNREAIKTVYGLNLNGIPYTIGLNVATPYKL